MATEEELKAWAAGDDVDGARRGRGRSGLSAGWWTTQAVVVGSISIYLAVISSVGYLLLFPAAVWMAYRARTAARQQQTWARLYGSKVGDDGNSTTS